MDSYELTATHNGFSTEPPLIVVTERTAEFSQPGALPMTFKRRFRGGLSLMSAGQVVASAARTKRPTASRRERTRAGADRQLVIEHLGDSWSLELRTKNWFERAGRQRSPLWIVDKPGDETRQSSVGHVFHQSQEVGAIAAEYADKITEFTKTTSGDTSYVHQLHRGSLEADLQVATHLPLPVTALVMRLALWFPPPRMGTWRKLHRTGQSKPW